MNDHKMKNSRLFICLFLFIFFGVCFRLPFYLSYPIPGVTGDSFAYMQPLQQIIDHQIPIFTLYTPGYPLFLSLTYYIGINTLLGVYLMQFICSIFAYSLALTYLFKIVKSHLLYYIIVLLSITYVCAPASIAQETNLSPICLTTSIGILSLCVTIYLFFKNNGSRFSFLLLSFCLAAMISLRPQSVIFLLPVIILLTGFLYNKNFASLIKVISVPVIVILTTCFYNYFTLNKFEYTNQSFTQKIRSSVFYLEKRKDQPSFINSAVDSLDSHLRVDFPNISKEKLTTENIANMDVYGDDFCGYVAQIVRDSLSTEKQEREISKACGNKNMQLYFKKVLFSFQACFLQYSSLKMEFYLTELKNRIHYITEKTEYTKCKNKELTTKEYYACFFGSKNINALMGDKKFFYRPIFIINTLYGKIFNPAVMSIIYFGVLFLSMSFTCIKFLRKKIAGSDFLWLSILFIPLANALIISLFVYPRVYYSYPTDGIILFSPLLLLALVRFRIDK